MIWLHFTTDSTTAYTKGVDESVVKGREDKECRRPLDGRAGGRTGRARRRRPLARARALRRVRPAAPSSARGPAMQQDAHVGSVRLDEARALMQSVQDLVVDGPRAALISRDGYHRPHTRGGGCEYPPLHPPPARPRAAPAAAGTARLREPLRRLHADAPAVHGRQPRVAQEGAGQRCR